MINWFRNIKQKIKFAWQRAYRGYDDSAWWDLHLYLAKIAAPILLQMQERTPGYPGQITSEEWTEILKKMQNAMFLLARDNFYTDEEEKEIDEGVELFGRWFRNLWT